MNLWRRRAFIGRGFHEQTDYKVGMAYVIPDTHKLELRAALDLAGWDIELAEPPTEVWWINELWRVRSRYRPVGVEAFLAIVGGPDGDGLRHPGASHITVGPMPTSWQNYENIPSFELSKRWPDERKRIVGLLAELRNAAMG